VKTSLALAVLLLAGCSHTAWHASVGQPHPNPQAQINSAAAVVAIIGLSMVAGGTYDDAPGTPFTGLGEQRRPPEMAPDRKISVQDCTKPLDYTLGNIRCK
jgi:hypothetical protein